MNDDDFKKNSAPTQNEDARFDVTSLDEVKDENGNGIFHMTRRFKWILILSLLLLIANAVLIWAVYNDKLVAVVKSFGDCFSNNRQLIVRKLLHHLFL